MAVQASESVVSAILKQVYPGAIEDQLNDEVAPWAVIQKEKVQLAQGAGIIRPMRVQRAQGIGSRNDADRLPIASIGALINANVKMASTYMVGQITGRVVRTSYDSQAAFENVLTEEMRFAMTDFVDDVARQVASGYGKLATVVSGATTSYVVDKIANLGVGQQVVVYNAAGNTEKTTPYSGIDGSGGVVIDAVNPTSRTITLHTSQTLAATDVLYRAGNYVGANTPPLKEMNGFESTIHTGAYFGINRSTYYQVQGSVTDGGAVALSEDMWQAAHDKAKIAAGGRVNIWFTDFNTRRKYLTLLASNKRYPLEGVQAPSFGGGVSQSKDLTEGLAEGLSFNGTPVVVSQKINAGLIMGLDLSTWTIYQQSEIEWVLNGDSVLHPLLSTGFDSYQYSLFYDAQPYCSAPQRNVKLFNYI